MLPLPCFLGDALGLFASLPLFAFGDAAIASLAYRAAKYVVCEFDARQAAAILAAQEAFADQQFQFQIRHTSASRGLEGHCVALS